MLLFTLREHSTSSVLLDGDPQQEVTVVHYNDTMGRKVTELVRKDGSTGGWLTRGDEVWWTGWSAAEEVPPDGAEGAGSSQQGDSQDVPSIPSAQAR